MLSFRKIERLPLCQLVDLGSIHVLYLRILYVFYLRSWAPGGFRVPSKLGFLDPFPDPQLILGLSLPPPVPSYPTFMITKQEKTVHFLGMNVHRKQQFLHLLCQGPFQSLQVSFHYKSDMGSL